MSYSQNGEDKLIENFFGDYKGTLLSIGENNGEHLSNALLFIEKKWGAVLIEPSHKVFPKLQDLHALNENVYCMNVAIGNESKEVEFYDSGTHLGNGDLSLLSTASEKDYNKWKGTTEFEKTKVQMITFEELLEQSPYKTFDYITIDAEGYDVDILRQMNLKQLGVKVICTEEHNGDVEALKEIRRLCSWYGLDKVMHKNGENIILSI